MTAHAKSRFQGARGLRVKLPFILLAACVALPLRLLAQTCLPPPSGLVSWWAGEGSAVDSSGPNNGTLQGGAGFAAGKVGQAFAFTNSTGYVQVPDNPSFAFGTNDFSIELWVKFTSLGGSRAFVAKDFGGGPVNKWIFWLNNGQLQLLVSTGGQVFNLGSGAFNPVLNQWHHVAVTRSGSLFSFYVDGAVISTHTSSVVIPVVNAPLTIGQTENVAFMGGLEDEVTIYNRALSALEIQAIYNADTAGKCNPPVAPLIVTQPQDQTIFVGAEVSLSVGASGSPPLKYQWRLDGTNVPGATNSSLTLTNVQLSQSGNYSVLVSNVANMAASAAALLTVLAPGSCLPPPSGIVSWWAGQGNAWDSLGINNGMLAGGAGFAAGKVGQAFSFTNGTGYVQMPDGPGQVFGTNDFSIELWVKFATLGGSRVLVAKDEGPGQANKWIFWLNNGQLQLLVSSGVQAVSLGSGAFSPVLNQWHHMAVTRQGAVFSFYVDGVPNSSSTSSVIIPVVNEPLIIGQAESLFYLGGLEDEVTIYNRALSALEIQAIYNADSAGKCNPPVPPLVLTQPQGQTIFAGAAVSFNVVASGSPLLSYQWRLNGTNVPGATNTSLALTNVQVSQSGNYSVLVSNPAGSTNSSNALLTVVIPTCVTPPGGVVGWWAGEGSAVDSSGPNNGVLQGGAGFAAGKVGQAFAFASGTGYVQVPDGPGLAFGANDFSIELWVKFASLGGSRALVAKDSGGGPLNKWIFWLNNGQLQLLVNSGAQTLNLGSGAFSPVLNQWHHVAVTRSGSVFSFYVDGVLISTDTSTAAIPVVNAPLTIGQAESLFFLGGLEDEVTIYNRALSAGEIQAIYNADSAGKCMSPPLITTHPASQTVPAGTNVNFSVIASGSPQLSYQWKLNGTNISGGTNTSLPLTNVQVSQSGNYAVLVSNGAGSTNSSNALLTVLPPGPMFLPSSNDLWDISRGAVLTGTSGIRGGFDGRDMFGGTFSPLEPSRTIFSDGQPDGFIHYIEWQTPAPVTVDSFALFAAGDTPVFNNEREFARFVLKAKSGPGATNFDLTLYSLDVTNHPYTFLDPSNFALVVANIAPVTAQSFRAEFTQLNAGRGFDGPRVVELDGFGTAAPSCMPPPSGLVSWWAGESNANDLVGGNAGTLLNGAAFAAGKVGQSFSFNGSGADVRLHDAPNLRFTTALTIEAWVNPSSIGTDHQIVSKWDAVVGPNQRSYGMSIYTDGRAYLGISTNGLDSGAANVFSTNAVPVNQWTHIAATYDGSALKIYLNGLLQNTTNFSGSIFPGTDDLGIGGVVGGLGNGGVILPFAGLIDEPTLYNRALSAAEILAIFNAGSAGKCPTPAPPTIVSQPNGQSVPSGNNVTFNVSAVGATPLGYQWKLNGTNISGATNTSLSLTNVQVSHSGNYAVFVSNSAGSTNSSNALLTVIPPGPVFLPSSNDLWDISRGAVITGTSGIRSGFDGRDMFGGAFSPLEPGNTIFSDGHSNGFVHYIEWQTPAPVTVDSFALFAAGDTPVFNNEREFARFVLKAKSGPGATNFDLTLYSLDVTNHPYTFLDSSNFALVATNIAPVTAQNFRAEFTQFNAGRGFDGPRIVELDGFGTAAPSCTPPPSGLISWWAGESNANDLVGGNAGALLNGAAFAGGKVGQAFSFNGAGAHVRVHDAPNLHLTSALTLEAWIYPTSVGGGAFHTIIDKWDAIVGPNQRSYQLQLDQSGNASVVISPNGTAVGYIALATTNPVPANQWTHLMGTYDGTNAAIYVNGVLNKSMAYSAGIFPGTNDMGLGGLVGGVAIGSVLVPFAGLIDEPTVYSRALSAAEILAIYNAGSAGKCHPVLPSSATVQIASVTANAGVAIVPVNLIAVGNENALGFSINFNPSLLTFTGITLGTGAPGAFLLFNTNLLASGKLGVGVSLPASNTFAAGTQQVVRISFNTAPVTNTTVTAIGFGDQPTVRQLSDAQAHVLAATYQTGAVTIPFLGYEGDVAPRPNGDNITGITDWVQVGRFVAGLDIPGTNSNEFQRADCAPRSTLGDGLLSVADWVQAGRYGVGLDPLTLTGGATGGGSLLNLSGGAARASAFGSGRSVTALDAGAEAGQACQVAIQLDSLGDENALGFSVTFNPAVLTFSSASLGSGANGATLNVNANQADAGTVGLALALPTSSTFAAGKRGVATLNFTVAPSASGDSRISFVTQPVIQEVADSVAEKLAADYVDGTLSIAPLVVGGRPTLVISPTGDGNLVISWSASAAGFGLESADAPDSNYWSDVSATRTTNFTTVSVTVPASPSVQFYRLHQH